MSLNIWLNFGRFSKIPCPDRGFRKKKSPSNAEANLCRRTDRGWWLPTLLIVVQCTGISQLEEMRIVKEPTDRRKSREF
jgi:hypothetical protein